jgi:hypothetical protein
VPAHNLPQQADWKITGLPKNSNHSPSDSYTLLHVTSAWDNDKYVDSKKFLMHDSALSELAVSDGVPGKLEKTFNLPATSYYLLYVGNVMELDSWSTDTGSLVTTGALVKKDANNQTVGFDINVTIEPPPPPKTTPNPTGSQGISYEWGIDNFGLNKTAVLDGNKAINGLDAYGVGPKSWYQGDGFGWTHTSAQTWIQLTNTSNLKITVAAAPEDTATALKGDLIPAWTFYKGRDIDAPADTSNHTWENTRNVSWAEDLTFIAYDANTANASSISKTFANLAPGYYSLFWGGNAANTAGNKNYKVTIETTAP